MRHIAFARAALLVGLAGGLSGCVDIGALFDSGSDAAADATAPITQADFDAFDAELARVQGMAPTSNLPMSGEAVFTGQTQMTLTNATTGDVGSDLLGDLSMEVDFDPAAVDPISTEISNLQALSPTGTTTILDGSLVSEPSLYESSLDVTTTTLTDVNGGTTELNAGTFETTAVGQVTDWTGDSEMVVTLGGVFVGDAAAAATGTIGGTLDQATSADTWNIDGTFYAEQ